MKRWLFGFLLIGTVGVSFSADDKKVPIKPVEIKVAVITPEGSTWTNVLREMDEELKKRSQQRLSFKIYAGGVQGDELDVLRKFQSKSLHAAGFSGVGLGVILPSIRIFEAPMLFKTNEEVDMVKEALYQDFASDFSEKGFEFLGFVEAGFVYLFSKTTMADVKDIPNLKMWVWKGDPVAQLFLDSFGIKSYPLHLADVNTSLETGMINSYYAPPLAAVSFQWYSKSTHMLDYPFVYSIGAFLINKTYFATFSKEDQALIKEVAGTYCKKLVELTRKDNNEALSVISGAGIIKQTPTAEQITVFEKNAQTTYQKSMPSIYSQAMLDKVMGLLKKYRSEKPLPPTPTTEKK